MKRASFAIAAAGALAFLAAAPADADTIALTSFSGGSFVTARTDQLYGWFFDLSAPVAVTALGVFTSRGGPLSVSHDVGIFAVSDQSLLVEGTVPAGSGGTLLDGFWYTSVSPTVLPAGEYAIMMTMPRLNSDTQTVSNTSETTSAPVTFETSAFATKSSLAYPTSFGALNDGAFGPNFTFTAVPEASTWAMLLLGFAGLGYAGSRAQKKTAALAT